jgi:hypothetical protein
MTLFKAYEYKTISYPVEDKATPTQQTQNF